MDREFLDLYNRELELLYEHADKVADGGTPWHKFWRQTLAKYVGPE